MTFRERYSGPLSYIAPIALGLLVALVGLAPWVVMARLNARLYPDIPWAAVATLAWLAVYLAWLGGVGPPGRWKAARRYRLRLWRPGSNGWATDGIAVTLSLMALIGLLAFVWILVGAPARPVDLSGYPSTVYLISIVVVGPLVAGVIEEAAYRGYMQRGLERHGAHGDLPERPCFRPCPWRARLGDLAFPRPRHLHRRSALRPARLSQRLDRARHDHAFPRRSGLRLLRAARGRLAASDRFLTVRAARPHSRAR